MNNFLLRRLYAPAFFSFLIGGLGVLFSLSLTANFWPFVALFLPSLLSLALGWGLLRGYELARQVGAAFFYLLLLALFRLLIFWLFGGHLFAQLIHEIYQSMAFESSDLPPLVGTRAFLNQAVVMIGVFLLVLTWVFKRCLAPELKTLTRPTQRWPQVHRLSDLAIFLLFFTVDRVLAALGTLFSFSDGATATVLNLVSIAFAVATCYLLLRAQPRAMMMLWLSLLGGLFYLWSAAKGGELEVEVESWFPLLIRYRQLEDASILAALSLLFYFLAKKENALLRPEPSADDAAER